MRQANGRLTILNTIQTIKFSIYKLIKLPEDHRSVPERHHVPQNNRVSRQVVTIWQMGLRLDLCIVQVQTNPEPGKG